jgi:hypothetical protein
MVVLSLSVVINTLWWSVLINGQRSTDDIAVCQMAHRLGGVGGLSQGVDICIGTPIMRSIVHCTGFN